MAPEQPRSWQDITRAVGSTRGRGTGGSLTERHLLFPAPSRRALLPSHTPTLFWRPKGLEACHVTYNCIAHTLVCPTLTPSLTVVYLSHLHTARCSSVWACCGHCCQNCVRCTFSVTPSLGSWLWLKSYFKRWGAPPKSCRSLLWRAQEVFQSFWSLSASVCQSCLGCDSCASVMPMM